MKINQADKPLEIIIFLDKCIVHYEDFIGKQISWTMQYANTEKEAKNILSLGSRKMGHSLNMFMTTYVGLSEDINKEMANLWVG